ncbi:hypothetical protein [Anaerolentibacter hominis]|uniref:hypothetical protein n=1 Tax=Anaerolentibacter hominis TaxID=3079009 RepID=UPI0031B820D9
MKNEEWSESCGTAASENIPSEWGKADCSPRLCPVKIAAKLQVKMYVNMLFDTGLQWLFELEDGLDEEKEELFIHNNNGSIVFYLPSSES